MSEPPVLSSRIPSLDGLRAISIIAVTLAHWLPEVGTPLSESWNWVKLLGAPGVNIFFVISGFLITNLLLKELQKTGRISLSGFYIRRSLRIIPAYLFMLGIFAVLTVWSGQKLEVGKWVAALTYTSNLFPDAVVKGLGHIWSLCVEEHFYLVWPFILVAFGARRAPWALGLILIISPVLRFLLLDRPGWLDTDYFTPTRLDTIVVGCLLTYFARSSVGKQAEVWVQGKGDVLIVLGFALLVLSVGVFSRSGKYALGPKALVEGVAVAVVIFAAVKAPNCLLGRLFNTRPFIVVGVLSYSLYLAQPFTGVTSWSGYPLSWWWGMPLTVSYALLSYFLIERIFLIWKDKLFHTTSSSAILEQPSTTEAAMDLYVDRNAKKA